MASFSPLVAILNQNKLTGSNYVDWKRNLDIVLEGKSGFVSHTKLTAEATFMDLFHYD